jgi:LPS O-antigen subunit length determinant protein (WzzB/FepE family)
MSMTFNTQSLAYALQSSVSEQLKAAVKEKLQKLADDVVEQTAEELTRAIMLKVSSLEDFAKNEVKFVFNFTNTQELSK